MYPNFTRLMLESSGGENRWMTDAWMIDELAYAGPEHLDADFVAGFDQKQGYPDPDEDLAQLEAQGLGADSAVVDLGAGTGQFALPAARRFGQVTAVDISPAMVRMLTGRAAANGLANLRCVRAGFLSYEHEGPPADGVYTRHALHQLPDFWKTIALGRIARILRPRGVLQIRDLIYDFQPDEASEVFGGWFDQASTDPAAGYTREDYIEHIRTEFSTYRWLFEPMLTAAGFEIVSAEYYARCFGEYTCIKTVS
jgi:ubiquinone/menaquinone biosynthesis C-methylase UbiE